MKVVNPVVITDAMVTSCTISEPAASETAWVSGTAYTVGQQRIRTSTHRVYQCVNNVTSTTPPESDTTNWADMGPTLKWAMFDGAVNTQSSLVSPLTVVIVPGQAVNSLALMELVGTSVAVTVKTAPGGTVVYSKTVSLDGTTIIDWYAYFFEPSAQLDTLVLTDIPPYPGCEITVSITGTGTVKCGVLAIGTYYDLGGLQYGATASIIDYSTKTTDVYGTTKITKRAYSKRMDCKVMMLNAALNRLYKLLATLRSTPVIWIGTDSDTYSPFVVFGWYRDFSIVVNYPTTSLCSLQVEGMI
jgi:hypothetical protein